MLRRMSASSSACRVRFASWWIKWARGCGEHGRCIRLWPSALESHACKPCTWPKLQPPTNPKAAQAAAKRRFAWLLLPRCDDVRGIAVGWPEKNVFQPVPLRSDDTTAAAARRGSDATILQRVEPSDAANAVAQPANKIEACPTAGDFQAYRKSRLTGQMSRLVEKPPACGRFGASILYSAR